MIDGALIEVFDGRIYIFVVILCRSSEVLPPDQEQAVPEVAVLPGRPRPEDPHLRCGHEEEERGRVPVLRAPGELGEGECVE